MTAREILIHADTRPGIGIGHLRRTMAVAHDLRQLGCAPHYIIESEYAAHLLSQVEIPFTKTTNGLAWLTGQPLGSPPLLLDSYAVTEPGLAAIRAQGYRVALFDDGCRLAAYAADVVIDGAPGADELPYRGLPETRFLTGPAYFPLRADLAAQPRPPQRHGILITFGGSDPDDVSARVAGTLEASQIQAPMKLVLGPDYQGAVRQDGFGHISIISNPADMAAHMAAAEIAVSGAGQTALEFAYLGVPAVLLQLSPDQNRIAAGLSKAGAAVDLGPQQDCKSEKILETLDGLRHNPQKLSDMHHAGRALIDGHGAKRIAEELMRIWFNGK